MQTKEELNAIKEEVASVDRKLQEATSEQLEQMSGGSMPSWPLDPGGRTHGGRGVPGCAPGPGVNPGVPTPLK